MEEFSQEGRGFRQRKKPSETICPICEVTLISSQELENHYQLEVDRLIKLQLNSKTKKSITNGVTSYHEPSTSSPVNGNSNSITTTTATNAASTSTNSDDIDGACPWIKFQKIRNNRHLRLKIKNKKRKIDDPICPICNEHPNEEINLHVELCLRKSDQQRKSNGLIATVSDDDDESIDIEGETFEEYEWAGQKRIRVSSLLEGGYAAVGIGSNRFISSDTNDEDEDLNVDSDLDTQMYGASQYSEKDIVPLSGDCESETSDNLYLRQLVAGEELSEKQELNLDLKHPIVKTEIHNKTINISNSINGSSSSSSSLSTTLLTTQNNNTNQVIESLKSKIREYENQISSKVSNRIKCLICMDEFHNPATSICCWHVHCEECWLRTLGTRKLCPQCNMITSPKDLRRIYM